MREFVEPHRNQAELPIFEEAAAEQKIVNTGALFSLFGESDRSFSKYFLHRARFVEAPSAGRKRDAAASSLSQTKS